MEATQGYYCEICDTSAGNEKGWLRHLNGRGHQKKISFFFIFNVFLINYVHAYQYYMC